MLDIKLIREQPDFVKAELAKRGTDPAEVDRLIAADKKRRKLQAEVDQQRADRKRRAREVGKLPPDERAAEIAKIRAEEADEEKLTKVLADASSDLPANVGNPLIELGTQLALAEREFHSLMLDLPNIPRADVPVGSSEADNRVIKTEGTPLEFTAFKPLPHWELGENLGIIDFDRGVKLSGTRFYVLSGAFRFLVDGKTVDGPAGSHVLVRAGVPHTFWNAAGVPARCLIILSPPAFAPYFRELSLGLADAKTDEDSIEIRRRLSARFDIEVVGPPIKP